MTAAWWEIRQGHVLTLLQAMPEASVQLAICSPPYLNLRCYSTTPQLWGGDPACAHVFAESRVEHEMFQESRGAVAGRSSSRIVIHKAVIDTATCSLCGCWRGELGAEHTPSLFVSHLVEVFAAVRRVLHPTGLLVVNLGDSYAGSGKGPTGHNGLGDQAQRQGFVNQRNGGTVPAKSLYLIPERFAIAMSDDGWIVRSRLAGVKIAPMPESCRDRPTSAWEHVYLFSKQQRYFWDQESVRTSPTTDHVQQYNTKVYRDGDYHRNGIGSDSLGLSNPAGANMRNWFYWPPANFAGAHFATFPTSVPETFVKAGSRPGDLVLDPFSGAGTTVLVANRLGRRGLGMELNPDYAQMARDRIQNDATLVHAISAAPPAAPQERLL